MARLSLLGLFLAILVTTGCGGVGAYTQPSGVFPYGSIYTESTSGGIILDNGATPSKEGKACGSYIIFVGTGDTSVEKAMQNGGIKKAIFVTQYLKLILGGFYGEVCTIVRGN